MINCISATSVVEKATLKVICLM